MTVTISLVVAGFRLKSSERWSPVRTINSGRSTVAKPCFGQRNLVRSGDELRQHVHTGTVARGVVGHAGCVVGRGDARALNGCPAGVRYQARDLSIRRLRESSFDPPPESPREPRQSSTLNMEAHLSFFDSIHRPTLPIFASDSQLMPALQRFGTHLLALQVSDGGLSGIYPRECFFYRLSSSLSEGVSLAAGEPWALQSEAADRTEHLSTPALLPDGQ